MSKVNLIGKSEYAKHRGCSPAAVTKALKHGRIVLIDGKIDPAVADIQWAANSRARIHGGQRRAASVAGADAPLVDPITPGRAGADQGGVDYWSARGRREAAEAELSELQLGEKRGDLVRRADVDRGAFEMARAMRDGLANCSRRLGATLAVITSPDECAAVIELEHRYLLESWSHAFRKMPGNPAADPLAEGGPTS